MSENVLVNVVTPRAGVWIEIKFKRDHASVDTVTPRAGVWIEIIRSGTAHFVIWSLPVRECGLKLNL